MPTSTARSWPTNEPAIADQRAGDHQPVSARNLAREPAGPGKAVEREAGNDADDEQKQEQDRRAEHGRGLLG
jgi:hypothetical protein